MILSDTPVTRSTSASSPSRPRNATIRRTPRDFVDMFIEFWWLGALAGVFAAVLIVVFRPRFEPIYRTEVSLLFEARKDRVLNIQEVVDTSLQTATELNTHMEVLRSKTFADYVLASFSQAETEMIQKAYFDPLQPDAPLPSLAAIIRPNVTVFARRGAPILGIQVSSRSPEAAALIANREARRYIDYNLDSASTRTNSAIVFLRNQAEETRSQVGDAENALQVYRAKHNLAAIGETQNVVLQKMSSLGTALVKAQLDQIDAKSLIEKIEEFQRGGRDLLEIPQILASGSVGSLRTSLIESLSRRTMLSERYLAQHPKMKVNDLEVRETRRILAESIAKAIADLRARDEVAGQYVQRLQAEMVGSEVQIDRLASGACAPDETKMSVGGEQGRQALPHDEMIFGEENGDGLGHVGGTDGVAAQMTGRGARNGPNASGWKSATSLNPSQGTADGHIGVCPMGILPLAEAEARPGY